MQKIGYRANKLKIFQNFPKEVKERVFRVIGSPENLLDTSNMFSAAVDARKGSSTNLVELWMMVHAIPKPKEDNTLLLISQFLMDVISGTVSHLKPVLSPVTLNLRYFAILNPFSLQMILNLTHFFLKKNY